MRGMAGLPGFGCCTPTLERETPDDRDKPPAPPHDRGHVGPQPVAGDAAILRARGCQVQPLLRPFARATWPGGRPRLPGAPRCWRDIVAGAEPNRLRASFPVWRHT